MKQKRFNVVLAIGVALALAGAVVALVGVESVTEYQEMGLTGIGMMLDGAQDDVLVVDQTGTGDIVEFRDNGTVVWRIADGGAVTHVGSTTETGNRTINGGVTVTGTTVTADLVVTDTITLESLAFSGPVVFGTSSSVVTGTRIAHGVGTTPTAVLILPQYSELLTQTVYILATNATSFTVGLGESVGVSTITTLHWMAGK